MKRRQFIHSIPLVTALSSFAPFHRSLFQRFKISLNAYSFNNELKAHTLTLDALLRFCKHTGFDAIDMTGYYFDGYPEVPKDETIFSFKRQAHDNQPRDKRVN